jgi:hypothetical protein
MSLGEGSKKTKMWTPAILSLAHGRHWLTSAVENTNIHQAWYSRPIPTYIKFNLWTAYIYFRFRFLVYNNRCFFPSIKWFLIRLCLITMLVCLRVLKAETVEKVGGTNVHSLLYPLDRKTGKDLTYTKISALCHAILHQVKLFQCMFCCNINKIR